MAKIQGFGFFLAEASWSKSQKVLAVYKPATLWCCCIASSYPKAPIQTSGTLTLKESSLAQSSAKRTVRKTTGYAIWRHMRHTIFLWWFTCAFSRNIEACRNFDAFRIFWKTLKNQFSSEKCDLTNKTNPHAFYDWKSRKSYFQKFFSLKFG